MPHDGDYHFYSATRARHLLAAQGFECSEAARVGTSGAPPESGLAAAWLALTEPNISGSNRGFRRPDALLHIVFVSDNDDQSDEVLGEDPVGTFQDFLSGEATSG